MGPWPPGEEVDAELVEDVPPRRYGDVQQVTAPGNVTVIGQAPPPAAPPGVDPMLYAQALATDSRGRAVTLFVEVPLLAYVALHPGISGLVRLGAAALGVYRVAQVLGKPTDYELQFSAPELP